MGVVAVPGLMDEVTPEWLTEALRAGGVLREAKITGAERVQIGAGVGILGELARVTLTYDREEAGAPRTLIAKIPTPDPNGRAIANMLGYYEREVRYYQQVAERDVLGSPRCYFSAMEPADVRFIVLMEDLSSIRIGDQVAGCGANDARVVVEELARFHAHWWNSPELAAIDWIPPANSPMLKLAQGSYLAAFEPFLEKFGGRLTAEQRDVVVKLGPRMNAMQDDFADPPATMLHADVRLDNIFFGSVDGRARITLIDWQILVRGRGPYDVAYFLSQSIDPAERKAIEEDLLRTYHATVTAAGADYPWEQCWDDYRLSVLFCLAYPVISGGSIDLANKRGLALVTAMADRSIAAITDLGAAELLARYGD